MKQTLTKDMFRFQMNQIRPDNFSYEGQGELFDYLDETDSELEFDPIAICCDFSQCSIAEFEESYSVEVEDNESILEAVENHVSKHGFWFAFVEDGKEIIFENF
jgi:hypothetical protein